MDEINTIAGRFELPVSESASVRVISLPMHADLYEATQDEIVAHITLTATSS